MGQYDDGGGDQSSAFHALVGRALVDAEFRHQLRDASQRDTVLRSIGIEPTSEMTTALESAMNTVDELANYFGDVKAAT